MYKLLVFDRNTSNHSSLGKNLGFRHTFYLAVNYTIDLDNLLQFVLGIINMNFRIININYLNKTKQDKIDFSVK